MGRQLNLTASHLVNQKMPTNALVSSNLLLTMPTGVMATSIPVTLLYACSSLKPIYPSILTIPGNPI
jgi:hypothetical protein